MSKQRVFVFLLLLISACAPSVGERWLIPEPKPYHEDAGIESFEPNVDVLFVIDDSGSMNEHQKDLANNVGIFAQEFSKKVQINFHIGVVTTSTFNGSGSIQCCGIMIGQPAFLDRNSPDLENKLAQRMIVGTNGSSVEALFEPVRMALTNPNLNGANKGFLRQDAHLAVVFITDAEDQSIDKMQDYLDFLKQLKKHDDLLLAYGVIVPVNNTDPNCFRDDDSAPPFRIEDFLSKVVNKGTNLFHLCSPDFGKNLANMGKDIANRSSGVYYLNRAPILESIHVTFGTQEIPNDAIKGWTFDPEKNAIYFADKIEWTDQPAGTKLKVYYKIAGQ